MSKSVSQSSQPNSPSAILFDLDDTLINTYRHQDPGELWREVIEDQSHIFPDETTDDIHRSIQDTAQTIWNELQDRTGPWLSMTEIRQEIVKSAFTSMGLNHHHKAQGLADEFTRRREESFSMAEGSIEILTHLREAGVRLALVTNGASVSQRWKINRFNLADYFDHIQIQEEAGVGKPHPDAYRKATAALGVNPSSTWMVGDNYEWEVVAPKSHGIFSIWYNPTGLDIPTDAPHEPDHHVQSHAETLDLFKAVSTL